jgi:hypothetical protein
MGNYEEKNENIGRKAPGTLFTPKHREEENQEEEYITKAHEDEPRAAGTQRARSVIVFLLYAPL